MADDAGTLRAQQLAFAAHVRDPAAHPPPPGVDAHRLVVYRDLFHNGMATLLAGTFPVIRATLGDVAWRDLVRAFYATHRCRTPLFTAIGGEFVGWLAERDGAQGDPPWLPELAHYEWMEVVLQVQDDDAPPVRVLAYAWPVHRIGPACRPAVAPAVPTLLALRRDAGGAVRFSEVSPLVFRLLQRVEAAPDADADDLLAALAAEAGRAGDATFLAEGRAMLRCLADEGWVPRALC